MLNSISAVGAITSLFLPWIFGCIWVQLLLHKTRYRNNFIVAGQGYLVGIFLTTGMIRLWSLIGMPLQFWPIAAIIAVLSITGLVAVRLQTPTPAPMKSTPSAPLEIWQRLLIALLLGLIAIRYTTLLQEIVLRPLFPWDAWMNWAPKATVWFHYNEMVPFVSPEAWLTASSTTLSYTEGAGNAWKYPITVPLIQLWGMLGMSTADNTLVYLPWFFVALAMGSALYGHLRLAGATAPLATLACYVLMNLPFFDVHVALAGYADIWVAAVFGCAVFALHEWGENQQWPYAALALFLALMCTQLKIPGLIMGGIVVLVFLTSVIRLSKTAWLAVLVLSILITLYTTIIGIDVTLPGLGRVALSPGGIVLPYIGEYDLEFHAIHSAMASTLFFMLNWNLLWYVFVLLGICWLVGYRSQGLSAYIPSLELRALLLTLLFILFVYYFTQRYKYVQDFTQINRALIYSIPVMVFYLFTTILNRKEYLTLSTPRNTNETLA